MLSGNEAIIIYCMAFPQKTPDVALFHSAGKVSYRYKNELDFIESVLFVTRQEDWEYFIQRIPPYIRAGMAFHCSHLFASSFDTINLNLIYEILAKDEDAGVRDFIAGNRELPEFLFSQLAQDDKIHIRVRITKNENIGVDVLKILAKDPEDRVRFFTMRNKNMPVWLLEKVAREDPSEDVAQIAKNIISSRQFLEKIKSGEIFCDDNF